VEQSHHENTTTVFHLPELVVNKCMNVIAVLLWWTRVLSVYARVQLSVLGSIDVMITEFKRIK
jgi:hypothetical protein